MRQIRPSTEETSTFMLELDAKGAGITYETAATLAIFPENEADVVEKLAKSQGWELDKRFLLKPGVSSTTLYPFPGPMTIREALTKFCDLTGLPLYNKLREPLESRN